MLVNGNSVYVFSIEKQTRRKLQSHRSINRDFNKLININSRIYLFDDEKVKCFNKTTEKFDIINQMKIREWYGVCYFSTSEVLIAGGYYRNKNFEITGNCSIYNTLTNKFTTIADLNIRRKRCSLVNVDGEIYCLGGNDGDKHLVSIEKYDSKTNKWEVLNVQMNIARSGHESVAHGNIIISMGGCDTKWLLAGIELFNTKSNNVTPIEINCTDTYLPLHSFGWLHVINSKIYLITGVEDEGDNKVSKTIEVLDITNPVMREGIDLPHTNYIYNRTVCTF